MRVASRCARLARQSSRGHWASIRVAHSTPPSILGVSIRAGRMPLIDAGCFHRRGRRRSATDAVRPNPSIPVPSSFNAAAAATTLEFRRRRHFRRQAADLRRERLMKPRGRSDPIRGGQSFRARPRSYQRHVDIKLPDPNPPCLRRLLIGLYTTMAAQREARRSR